MINSCFTLGGLTSLVAAFIFLSGLGFWSPSLLFLTENLIYAAVFVLIIQFQTFSSLIESTFIAKRRSGFVLARISVFNALKLLLPILLMPILHSFGIVSSWGISLAVTFLLGIFLFLPQVQPGYHPSFKLKTKAMSELLHFSFANYIFTLLWNAPGYILPLVVVNMLGAKANAYFFIAWSVGSVFFFIPTAVSTSLFAEGSSDVGKLDLDARRSMRLIFLIIVPVIIVALLFADKLLFLVGGSYSKNGATLLRIFVLSTLPLSINLVYLYTKMVERKFKVTIGLALLMMVLTLGLAFLLLPSMQINGAGIAWLISQSIIALLIGTSWFLKRPARGDQSNNTI